MEWKGLQNWEDNEETSSISMVFSINKTNESHFYKFSQETSSGTYIYADICLWAI